MRFKKVTGDDEPYIKRRKFKDLLGNATYADGLINYTDKDGDGSVSCKSICEEIAQFRASFSPGSKLRGLVFTTPLQLDMLDEFCTLL